MAARWIVPVALAAMPLLDGCRMSNLGKDYPESTTVTGGADASTQKPPVIQPQRQAEVGNTLAVTVDDEGRLREELTLRLDYFPPPRPDGVSIPTCYQEIAGHLIVGRIFCEGNGNIAADVIASQVNQQCYTATPVRKLAAKSSVVLFGCKGAARIQTYRYEPDLKLEVLK
jgi:hypothetical protein